MSKNQSIGVTNNKNYLEKQHTICKDTTISVEKYYSTIKPWQIKDYVLTTDVIGEKIESISAKLSKLKKQR